MYRKTINIETLSHAEIAALRPGQWVTTSNDNSDKTRKGIFLGVKASGSVVVAWYMNAKQRNYKSYVRALRNYAIG